MRGTTAQAGSAAATLPPGQREIEGFPRFGTHLHRPPPAVPHDPAIQVSGAGISNITVPVADLQTLPRRQLSADFHCVAGWSATGLLWEGAAFETFYRATIELALQPDVDVRYVVFGGLDGFESVLMIEDALDCEVLLADRLNGAPLGADHGAPARLVSPKQYGYMNTKHLCSITLHSAEPTQELGAAHPVSRRALRGPLIKRHPRARVWHEERHPDFAAWWLRPIYRLTIRPGVLLSRRRGRLKS